MFSALSRFTERYKFPIIATWLLLAVVLVIFSPSLSRVGVTDDSQFLPSNTESIQAQNIIKTRFTSALSQPAGSTTIVIYDAMGLNSADQQITKTLFDWLSSEQAPREISGVVSVLSNEALRSTLQSTDGTTQLINVDLSVASSSGAAHDAVKALRNFVAALPSGPTILVTGNAGISADALTSIHDTINKATLVTVILVIILLLIIYRSPIAMLVPLVTIGIAYLISRSIAGFIAGAGMNISSLVDAYLVVTLFGVGTDYCLFMVSRFKEEITHNNNGRIAVGLTLARIGPVILASATMVIVALLCLGISRFGMNRSSGFILAIGVAVTLLAGLTLTPALISTFGRKLLWPAKLYSDKQVRPGFWQRLGGQVTRRPLVFIIPIIVVLALPYLALNKLNYSASLIGQMPGGMDSVKGYNLFKDHFPSGKFNPAILVIESNSENLSDSANILKIKTAAGRLPTIPGVSGVVYFASPANQLQNIALQLGTLAANLNPTSLNQLSGLQNTSQILQNLAVTYPGLLTSSQFQDALQKLTGISTRASAFNTLSAQESAAAISQIQAALTSLSADLSSLASQFNLENSGTLVDWLKSNYFSTDGKVTRLDLTLPDDPYAQKTIASIPDIRTGVSQILQSSGLPNVNIYVGGAAADQADIISVNDSDFLHVLLLAIAGILLVSILLLRSFLAPLYMILTVLFNFGATMGIAAWLFIDVLGQSSLIYMLPIFVFVILVAVGSDYNIFLMTRIKEEAQKRPLKEAITLAVANTGGVITSCGIILAGTFATLTTASLQMVFQVGAAIALGVLIDTFLVRAVVIPSLAALAGRWNWWPSRLGRKG